MKRPASSGQHCSMGIMSRSTSSPVKTTSWHKAFVLPTIFGGNAAACRSIGKSFILSASEEGGAILRYFSMSRVIFSMSLTPSAVHIRRVLPSALIRTGMDEPSTFSNNRALPPPDCFDTRSVISAISSIGDTDSLMRTSSLSVSSCSMNSVREW